MSDDILSQEEIEALLSGGTIDTPDDDKPKESLATEDYLTELEQDTLGEVGNISFGSSATALSALLGQKVEITTPKITVVKREEMEQEFVHPYVAIQVEYTTGLSGTNLLVIKQSDAAIIADLMLGGDGSSPNEELGEIHLSAVQEAMNQMMGSAATSMSTMFNVKVDISPPTIDLLNISQEQGVERIPPDDLLIKVAFNLQVGDLIDSEIMQVIPLEFGKDIVNSLINGTTTEEVVEEAPEVAPPPSSQPTAVQEQQYEQPQPQPQTHNMPQQQERMVQQKPQVEVQQPQFAEFSSPDLTEGESNNLNMLLDIPLRVTVELGRTKRSVKEILEFSSGSIIELDKLAGEPVDILVNNRLIANGEVVVIDENFGVRITDVLSQADRLNKLR